MPDFFSGEQMTASSVTGTGPGESHGLQKPELHSGCGCCSSKQPVQPKPPRKRGCFSAYKANCGSITYRSNNGKLGSKSCF